MVDFKGKPFFLTDEDIRWVEETLAGMSTDEKVGQLFCPLGLTDNEYYLHHDFNRRPNINGTLFLDEWNLLDPRDWILFIYGHHMKNGSMFASLHQYVRQEFYDDHKYIWYLTPDHIYRLDVLAGYVGDGEAEIYTIFVNRDELDSYLSFAERSSTFTPDHRAEDINGIVALSTCSYEYDDARYVLVCVPVMID